MQGTVLWRWATMLPVIGCWVSPIVVGALVCAVAIVADALAVYRSSCRNVYREEIAQQTSCDQPANPVSNEIVTDAWLDEVWLSEMQL
jgi:hypothetical protein